MHNYQLLMTHIIYSAYELNRLLLIGQIKKVARLLTTQHEKYNAPNKILYNFSTC